MIFVIHRRMTVVFVAVFFYLTLEHENNLTKHTINLRTQTSHSRYKRQTGRIGSPKQRINRVKSNTIKGDMEVKNMQLNALENLLFLFHLLGLFAYILNIYINTSFFPPFQKKNTFEYMDIV